MRPGSHEDLTFSVSVDSRVAGQLNVGDPRLEATLVLHTALGKDNFVVVTGEYGELSRSIARLGNCGHC